MIIIPAIDIREGKCVRLVRGVRGSETIYSHNPAEVARRWESKGAELLHVVDIDGAFDGRPQNMEIVGEILNSVSIPIQVGGGIRDMESIRTYVSMGVNRIILGTAALENSGLIKQAVSVFPGKILVAIDAKDDKVTIEGWTEVATISPVQFVSRLEKSGVVAVIYTDTYRDGTEAGLNLEGIRRLADSTSIPVIASGGVSSIRDIKELLKLEPCGVVGVITGKAVYNGSLDLEEAIRTARGGNKY
ncbi:MAG TPA: 1-(5-phosphoribosyl)-5-[(5-phosphoribosylamino)methylideneamino]imidazole-4-carboxamide isomerase [Syntrophaceae bacterium]|nr:1-(5-phosphoribosyl)-5-[(5-phosphoribosylamino)methylideneamino]imidazole-4-carboxamide isomerase [Syntrophaceae bacterium]